MAIALEIAGSLIALALLFLPVSTFFYMAVGPEEFESGFVLADIIIAVIACALVSLSRSHLHRDVAWSNVWRYFGISVVFVVCSWLITWALAVSINVVDSSHGGAIIIVPMATLGVAAAATVYLAERTRRAL
jgi:MFS-type transporter involved in bile tolerance (Atg22 family)